MPLYEITSQAFRPIEEASFADLKVKERGDLQRLLRAQIEVLGDDLYVLAEEFGEWEDSRRRIDLLAIDKLANLVVIELKRTNDGGHMELQAIRYAAMVSAMTFVRAVEIHEDYLRKHGENHEEASDRMLAFLTWDEPDEERFALDVRILLVSADFGKELTTAVLWLRDREIDIRCIRFRPYLDGNRQLVDVEQLIPLAEAHDYQVQLREKGQVERKKRVANDDVRHQFWNGLVAIARRRGIRHGELSTGPYTWIGAGSGFRGMGFNYNITMDTGTAELYIDRGDRDTNKAIYDHIFSKKEEVERKVGEPLSWHRIDRKQACRIKYIVELGGYKSPESEWPSIQEAMVEGMRKLEFAILPVLESLEQ